ncbi:TPA: hypothetical protein SLC38_003571 [Morganella morganii]|uniref:hypothetical protein n=1 Tax=Morganella morganii TaxID=582 RepID=UPI00046A29CA|nr:hypothetical protein [Morganella morganii]HEI8006615.1 hypothetical protein [Morganella morganii]
MNAYAAQDAQEERIDFTEDVIFGLSTETLEYLGTEKENEIREAIDKALRKRSAINGNGRLFRA